MADHVRPASFVPETKRVDADAPGDAGVASSTWPSSWTSTGGTVGFVTLEDLIEELVGEIVDEFDGRSRAWRRLEGGGIVVAGRMPIDDVAELLGSELPEGGWDSVGGLLLDMAGASPPRASRSPWTGSGWWPSESRAGGSTGCASSA